MQKNHKMCYGWDPSSVVDLGMKFDKDTLNILPGTEIMQNKELEVKVNLVVLRNAYENNNCQ